MTDIKTAIDPAETDALLQTVREQIALQTFNPNDSELLKQMVESMGDSRGMVRLSFAEIIGGIGKPATPFLLEALENHPNPVVRRASAKTLTRRTCTKWVVKRKQPWFWFNVNRLRAGTFESR